ncbi:hypothetical protein [Acidithiobacillus sp.]|nr:hypothetical protein [Acidithiobacillus sp.]MDD5375546.1 hypothetical protein [Acidithiobacillus sp.]
MLNLGVEDTIPVHADYYGNTYLSVLEGMPRFVFGSVTVKF